MTTLKSTKKTRGRKEAAKPRAGLVLEKSAGAVVFRRSNTLEYLLIYSNYWEFPKGQVEADESESAAALREVREETGLEIDLVPGFREETNYFYRRIGSLVKKQVVYFLGRASRRDVKLSWEHQAAEWLPFDKAIEQLKYESARALLEKAKRFLTAGDGRHSS